MIINISLTNSCLWCIITVLKSHYTLNEFKRLGESMKEKYRKKYGFFLKKIDNNREFNYELYVDTENFGQLKIMPLSLPPLPSNPICKAAGCVHSLLYTINDQQILECIRFLSGLYENNHLFPNVKTYRVDEIIDAVLLCSLDDSDTAHVFFSYAEWHQVANLLSLFICEYHRAKRIRNKFAKSFLFKRNKLLEKIRYDRLSWQEKYLYSYNCCILRKGDEIT